MYIFCFDYLPTRLRYAESALRGFARSSQPSRREQILERIVYRLLPTRICTNLLFAASFAPSLLMIDILDSLPGDHCSLHKSAFRRPQGFAGRHLELQTKASNLKNLHPRNHWK